MRPTSFSLSSRVSVTFTFCTLVEQLDDGFPRLVAEGAEEDRGQDPLLAVDLGVDQLLLLVDLELQPGAAVGDDAGGVDALLVGEDDAGGAVDLADHHALGAVDDEGALVRHDGDVPHVDLFLPDLARVQEDEIDLRLQGDGVGEPLLLALLLAELDVLLVQGEPAVLQEHVAVGALDGERGLEDLLQALLQRGLALQQGLPLEESLVGGELDVDEIRDLHDILVAPAKKDPLDLLGLVQIHSVPLSQRIRHPQSAARVDRHHRRRQSPVVFVSRYDCRSARCRREARRALGRYWISTTAPAASSCVLIFAASSLETFSLRVLFARFHEVLRFLQAETRDGADFLDHRDLLGVVVALQHDGELRLLLRRRACRRRRGPAAIAIGAAAVTPNFSSIALTSSETSRTVIEAIASRICSFVSAAIYLLLSLCFVGGPAGLSCEDWHPLFPTGYAPCRRRCLPTCSFSFFSATAASVRTSLEATPFMAYIMFRSGRVHRAHEHGQEVAAARAAGRAPRPPSPRRASR